MMRREIRNIDRECPKCGEIGMVTIREYKNSDNDYYYEAECHRCNFEFNPITKTAL